MTVDVSTVRDRYARWQENVAGVLAKSTRKAVEDLPADPERLLDSPTYDGFPVRPLYTSLDGLAEPALPGHWPFTRGGDAHRDVLAGWKVTESFPIAADADVATVNGAILLALTDGTSALEVRVGAGGAGNSAGVGGVAVDQLDRAFEGVFLDLVPVILDAGTDVAGAADQLLALVQPFDADQRSRLSIDLGADPLTAPLSGRVAAPEADVVATAAKLTEYDGGVRAVTVDADEARARPHAIGDEAVLGRQHPGGLAGGGDARNRVQNGRANLGVGGVPEMPHVGGKVGGADEDAVDAGQGQNIVQRGKARPAFDLQDQADLVVRRGEVVRDA